MSFITSRLRSTTSLQLYLESELLAVKFEVCW